MKVYFLRLTQANFVQTGSTWRTETIDLYDNDIYRNFSVTRSAYGLNSLGDGTWTGLRSTGPDTTDTGQLVEGRYLDTSGRIDLVSWWAEGGTSHRLTAYTAHSDSAAFPDEFVASGPFTPADEIGVVDSPRWARFELEMEDPQPSAFTVYVRVEIDRPVMVPFHRGTRALLDQFPSWMAIRELETADPATPSLATPTSLGGAVLNSLAGEWLEGIGNSLTYLELQNYIQSADINQLAWVYRAVPPDAGSPIRYLWSVDGDGIELAQAFDLAEFYEVLATPSATPNEDVYYWDEDESVLYAGRQYATLALNGTTYNQEPHHVWNVFDDFGLLVDLRRHRLEGNESFRNRILDVHRNRPGVGVENFKLALRRELNIWKVYGATPSSTYLGATPEVLEMEDLEQDSYYVDPDGMPTKRFVALAEHLARTYPTTWGYFHWDRARWDVGGTEHKGFGILPYRLDATPLSIADMQAGVGDGNDLLILRPDSPTGPHEFSARLKIRGREKSIRNEYPPVEFEFEVHGRSDRKIYSNPANAVWMTVEVTVTGGAKYFHSFLLTATSDVDVDRPEGSPASYSLFRFLDDDGTGTDDSLTFASMTNGADYPGGNLYPGKIPLSAITNVTLRHGRWDVATQSYPPGFLETADTFEAWFSHDPDTILQWNTSAGAAPSMTGGPAMPQSGVVLKSKETDFTIGQYTSERIPYRVKINEAVPPTSPQPVTIPLSPIVWDPFQEATPNREIVVELTTKGLDEETGAYTVDEAGAPVFLPDSYLRLDGDAAWTDGQKVLPGNTTQLTFSTASGAAYPLSATVWNLFEAVQTTAIEGIVDDFGPWRNGQPPPPGNTNFALQTVTVDRSDFGVSHSDDRVVTWMGVDVEDDPRVIAWLDSNTVRPAVADASTVEYPANAIQEVFSGGIYSYEPFVVRVRLRIDPDPRWNPYMHSGWYYQGDREGYVYAKPDTETATGATHVLGQVARQGAPIIVHTDEASPQELRQVAFGEAATPTELSLVNRQVVRGTGTRTLYLAYTDVYDVSVTEVATGATVGAATSTTSSELLLDDPSDRDKEYEVTYTLARSFYADHEYEDVDGNQRTRLVFDDTPATYGVSGYRITYETSRFDPATPIDLPLSPLYTSLHEGFIFLSHDEYGLDRVDVSISPSKLVANGSDYAVISLRSLDRYGNPKAGQSLTLSTNFGTLDRTSLQTDADGFATALLTAANTDGGMSSGVLTVSGAANAAATFGIEPAEPSELRLYAIPAAEQIPADGRAMNVVYGKVEEANFRPYPYALVRWKRARSLYELFALSAPPSATPTSLTSFVYYAEATPVAPPAATPVTVRTVEASRPTEPVSRGCMHGWYAGGNSYSQLQSDETNLGKDFAVVRYYHSDWDDGLKNTPITMANDGRLVLSSHKPPGGGGGWARVASGAEDDKIDELADDYKALDREIVFIFHHEPHDDASDVKAGGSYGTSAEYKAAWRRIVNRFRNRGANKVKFGYCAVAYWAKRNTDKCYPGDDIIDLFCHDGYNWYDYNGSSWESFEDEWAPIVQLCKDHEKPLIIGEFGSHPSADGHDLDQWFIDAASYLKNDADANKWVIGFCYYHTLHEHDWRFIGTNTHGSSAHGNPANEGRSGWITGFVNDSYFKDTPFPIDQPLSATTLREIVEVTTEPLAATPSQSLVAVATTQETAQSPQAFSGVVIADAAGGFTIGPFVAAGPEETGYWFVSAEIDGGVFDSFDRADGPLTSTGSGESWDHVQSSFSISGRGAVPAAATAMSVIDTTWSDVGVETRIDDSAASDSSIGPVVRYSDNDNYFYVLHDDRTAFRIRKVQNGTHSDLTDPVTPSPTLPASSVYSVRLEADGSELRLYVNGALLASETSTHNQTATAHGMRNAAGSTSSKVDSISIAELNASDSGIAGDVVFWHEYPDVLYGAQPFTGLPRASVQDATPFYAATPYADGNQFPSYYDEATPYAPATPITTNWLPPRWYAIPKYQQYQLGLLGNTPRQVTYDRSRMRKFRKAL